MAVIMKTTKIRTKGDQKKTEKEGERGIVVCSGSENSL